MIRNKRLLKIFAMLLVFVTPMSSKAQVYNYNYNYDANGNVVARKKAWVKNLLSVDSVALKKEILIGYELPTLKARISLVNSQTEDNKIRVSLYNANTNMLVKQQTIVGNEGEMDLTSESSGIYVITATDQDVSASSKILKE